MTKIISTAAILLASSVALAYPTVGDHVLMSGTATKNGKSGPFSLERTIKSFDAGTQEWLITETQTIGGQASTADENTADDDMLDKATIDQVILNCKAYGGKAETLVVKAGTFATCALPNSDADGNPNGTIWVGDVEFGIVKVVGSQSGVDYTLEVEQHSGK